MLKGKKVLLGVTGSISAYKACDLVQRLKEEGAQVRVILTPSAARLVHPNTFAALTGHKVPVDAWTGVDRGVMDHIDFARWADLLVVAPCTAHTLGEFAQGLTGSLLSLVYLAFQGNAYIAPAMNPVMLDAPAVRRNLDLLRAKGDVILPTGEGVLACGEVGDGKLLDVPHIVRFLKSHLAVSAGGPYPTLAGKRVLLSLGHTREKWDEVRYISNRSSGRTGLALARAFQLAGARVEAISGVTEEVASPGLVAAWVETSEDFRREMLARQAEADVVIMAAAIADFVPAEAHKGKVKASRDVSALPLRPFPNILAELGERKRSGQVLVGFALETKDALVQAQEKMNARNCDAMVVNNPVATETGFGKGRVKAAILVRDEGYRAARGASEEKSADKDEKSGAVEVSLTEWDKDELAAAVVARVAALLGG